MKLILKYIIISLILLLFQGVSYSQENSNNEPADSTNVTGKVAFDVMTWFGYTITYLNGPVRQNGFFTHAYKDVSYRLRVTYPIKKYRVGLDFSIKEIIKDEKLTHGIMTNGLQTINLTADYTFNERNNLKLGGYLNFRIYHLKFNEDIQNDFAQLGIIAEKKINANMSLLLIPVYSFSENWNVIKSSIYLNAGLRFIPSMSNSRLKSSGRKFNFAIAIAYQINMTKQKLQVPLKARHYLLYPYFPFYRGEEYKYMYFNAFASPGRMFPVIEFGIRSNKLVSHTLGFGYSFNEDSISHQMGVYTDGTDKTILTHYRISYQYDHIILKKWMKNYSNVPFYPYLGGKITLNYNDYRYSCVATSEDCNFTHYSIYTFYNDTTFLIAPQLTFGLRSHHNRLFFDAGICFNLAAFTSGSYDYLTYCKYPNEPPCNVSGKNGKFEKTLYVNDLWKNRFFADNIYFKIGYVF